jgi:hypothetical protein
MIKEKTGTEVLMPEHPRLGVQLAQPSLHGLIEYNGYSDITGLWRLVCFYTA